MRSTSAAASRSPAEVVHRLFDPLIEAASAMGAGLDWKTSLQELSAEHGLGVPEYVIEDDGPDHMKTFTAQVRVGEALYGNGVGRSKKEAEQAAAETAYGEIAADLGVEDPAVERRPRRRGLATDPRPTPCRSCPRSRSSARGLERHVARRHDHPGRRPPPASRAPRPARSRRLRRRPDRTPDRGRPPARQVPLAARSTTGTRCSATSA